MAIEQPLKQPFVSICMPAYNAGKTIGEALGSVLAQTYRNLEIIVGDDASSDDTSEIVHCFQDPRIQYQRNSRNLGQFENVNCLLQKATGQYIAIYHSDDIYDPNIVEKEVNVLETYPEVGSVFTMNWQIDYSGEIIGQSKLVKEAATKKCLSLTDVLPVLLRYKNHLLIGPSFMGRSEVFQKVGLFSSAFSIAGDFEMWLRILNAFKIYILDEPLMSYRHGKTQVSYGYQNLRTFEDHFFTIIDHYLEIEDLRSCVDPVSITEYAFHRCDDTTFRAANWVIQGYPEKARQLLDYPYPWQTLITDIQYRKLRRKLRVLLLRILLNCGLYLKMLKPLTTLLIWTEYGGHI